MAVVGAVGFALLALRPFRVVVHGKSMSPTLEPGDFLLATRGRVRRGAIAVVEHPSRRGYEMVKRVAGVPGDRIGALTLAHDEYWLLGDNPALTTDSRSFGPVGAAAVKGIVRARYWPRSRAALFAGP